MKNANRAYKQLEVELSPILDKFDKNKKNIPGLLSFILYSGGLSLFMSDVNTYRKIQNLPFLLPRELKTQWENELTRLREKYSNLQDEAKAIEKMNVFKKYRKSDQAIENLNNNIKDFRNEATNLMLKVAEFNENLVLSVIGLSENIDAILDKKIKEISNFYFKLKTTPDLESYERLNEDTKALNAIIHLREDRTTPFIPRDSLEKIKEEFHKIPSQYTQLLRQASTQKQFDSIIEDYKIRTEGNSNNFRIAIQVVGKALSALDKATQILNRIKKENDPSIDETTKILDRMKKENDSSIKNKEQTQPNRSFDEAKGRVEDLSPERLAEIRQQYRRELPAVEVTSERINKPS